MHCASCDADIPAEFIYAFQKNECPACGGQILDEESIALIGDLQASIMSEVRLREESVARLSLMLVTNYTISPRHGFSRGDKPLSRRTVNNSVKRDKSTSIIHKEDLVTNNGSPISEEERDRIMEECITKRYGTKLISNGISAAKKLQARRKLSPEFEQLKDAMEHGMSDNELFGNTVLEEHQAMRIAKQKSRMASGGASGNQGTMVSRSG